MFNLYIIRQQSPRALHNLEAAILSNFSLAPPQHRRCSVGRISPVIIAFAA